MSDAGGAMPDRGECAARRPSHPAAGAVRVSRSLRPLMPSSPQRVLIVAENTSARMGGEAILPLQYFTRLRARGMDVWLITHERVRDELAATLGADIERVQFLRDTAFQKWAYRFGMRLPRRVADVTVGFLIGASTGRRMRRLARQTVRAKGITVVHQPAPVSPKLPSHLYDVGAPTGSGR